MVQYSFSATLEGLDNILTSKMRKHAMYKQIVQYSLQFFCINVQVLFVTCYSCFVLEAENISTTYFSKQQGVSLTKSKTIFILTHQNFAC